MSVPFVIVNIFIYTGLWWEDKLQAVKVRFNRQNALTKFFHIPEGDELRKQKAPIFLFGRRGQPLSPDFARLQTTKREEFVSTTV